MDIRKYNFTVFIDQPELLIIFVNRVFYPKNVIFVQVFAYEESEKYKEGKFIIERFYLAKKTDSLTDKDQPDL